MPAKPGNRNAAKGTAVRNSLLKSLKQWSPGNPDAALRKITDTLVEEAMDPKSSNYQFAVKEIGLRIDGSPKSEGSGGTSSTVIIGVSEAFAGLIAAQSGTADSHGEIIVQDRPVLPSEVRSEAGGRGEAVGVRQDTGGSAES